jgi:O-antigen/teichoic acid export membrane protein
VLENRSASPLKSSLKSDTALYAAAVMAERLLGLLLLPLLTRHLPAADYGVWAQTLVVSGVLMPLVVMCLPAAIVRSFSAGLSAEVRRAWMLRTVALAGFLFLVIGLAASLAGSELARAIYGSAERSDFVPVLVTLLAADALLDLLIAFLRSGFRMRWIALLMLARGGLRFGFMLAALAIFGWTFQRAFLALAVLQLVVVAAAFVRELLRSDAPASNGSAAVLPSWRALLTFAAPLVLVSVLTSINSFGDRFVLTHLLGLDRLAVYAAVSSLVSLTGVAYTVLGFTLFPVLSRLWVAGDLAGAQRLTGDTVRVFLFVALPYVLWLAGSIGSLLPLLTTQAYRVGSELPVLLGLAAVAFGLYQIMLYLLLLSGRGLHAAWMMLAAAALNLTLNLVLVPSLGLLGAAIAAAGSNAMLAALAYAAAKAKFPWRSAGRIGAAACAAGGAAWLFDRQVVQASWAGVSLSLLAAGLICVGADLAGRGSVIRAFVWRKATSS